MTSPSLKGRPRSTDPLAMLTTPPLATPPPPPPPLPLAEDAMRRATAKVAALRAELPALAEQVCVAAGHDASCWWEFEVRRVITQNPPKAAENAFRFPDLKGELRTLQGQSAAIARSRYEHALSQDTIEQRIAEVLRGPVEDRDALIEVSTVGRQWEEPLRLVYGELGAALDRAGLTTTSAVSLDPNASIDPNGRFRFTLELSDGFVEAVRRFDAHLAEIAAAILEVEELDKDLLVGRVLAMWEAA